MGELRRWLGISKDKDPDLSNPANLLDEEQIRKLVAEHRTPLQQGTLTVLGGDSASETKKYVIPPPGFVGARVFQVMDVIFFKKFGITKPAIESYLTADQAQKVDDMIKKAKGV
jgi:hypothetical protein